METLIKIQALISNIEEFTLESKYRSTFDYKDNKTMEVKPYCWQQAAAYKKIFDDYAPKNEILIILIENAKLTFKIM